MTTRSVRYRLIVTLIAYNVSNKQIKWIILFQGALSGGNLTREVITTHVQGNLNMHLCEKIFVF